MAVKIDEMIAHQKASVSLAGATGLDPQKLIVEQAILSTLESLRSAELLGEPVALGQMLARKIDVFK